MRTFLLIAGLALLIWVLEKIYEQHNKPKREIRWNRDCK